MGVFMAWLGKVPEFMDTAPRPQSRCYLIITAMAVLLPGMFLSSCNSDSYVVPGASISITPSSSSYDIQEVVDEDGFCVYYADYFQDVPLSISLTDEFNRALTDAPMTVYVDFSGNTFSGEEVLQLFHDKNGNGVVDTLDERVSGASDEAFRTRTSSRSGTIELMLRMNLSCAYRGSLYAFSGPAAAVTTVSTNGANSDSLPAETEGHLDR